MPSDTRKTNFVWKKIKGRRFTDDVKKWYEEFPGTLTFPHTSEIWADNIPTPAPGTTTSVVQYYDDLKLTEDSTVADHKAWLACETPGDTSTQLKEFVPPRFHQSYTVRVFEDDGSGGIGDEVPTTHPSDWFFDYENGVLVFENDPTSFGLTPPFHIKVYRYIGAKGAGGGSSSPSKLQAFLREASTVTVSAGSSSVDVSSQMSGKTPGGNETTTGVVTDPPYNRCPVLTSPDRDEILTPDGNKVFGRLTESGGTWTLSLKYIAEDGTETDYAPDADTEIIWGYYEVLDFDNWPVFDDSAVLPSDQVVGDIPNATTTQSGKVMLAEDNEITANEVVRADDPRSKKTREFALLSLTGNGSIINIEIAGGVYSEKGLKLPDTLKSIPQTANSSYLVYLNLNSNEINVSSASSPPPVPDNCIALYRFSTDASANIDETSIEDLRPIYLTGQGGGSGKLGTPPDGTYDDGLLDFTSDTQINDAVDQINEVLKYLAPDNAEPLAGDIVWDNVMATGKVAGGLTLNYVSAGQQLTTIFKETSLTGHTPDPATKLNYADKGILRIYKNDTEVDNFDLGSHFNEGEREGNQSYPPATSGNGYLTITSVGWYNDFPLWQKGNADVSVGSLSAGDVKIKLSHDVNGDGTTLHETNEFVGFCDPETARPGIASGPTLTEDTPVFKYLSGVKFYGLNSTFKVSFTSDNHIFEYTYVDTPAYIQLTGMTTLFIDITAGDPAVSVPNNPPHYDDTLTVTDKVITLDAPNESSTSAKVNVVPRDPWGDGTSAQESITDNRLIDTYPDNEQPLDETFHTEKNRLPATYNFDDKTGALTDQWDSTQALTNGNAQVFAGRLIYPQTDYTSGYLPTQTVNYSGFSGDQEYYRAFYQSGTPHNSGRIQIGGITQSDLGTKVDIYIKLPTQTGWLDLSKPYNAATFTGADGDGAQTAISESGGFVFVDWSSGTFSTADSGYRYFIKVVLHDSSVEITRLAEVGW